MTQETLTKEERLKVLKRLLESNEIFCTGDQLIMERTVNGQPMAIPVAVFLRKNENSLKENESKDDVFLGTPTGLILFECNDFHKYAQERAKTVFLENLDKMLRQKTAVLNIKTPKNDKK